MTLDFKRAIIEGNDLFSKAMPMRNLWQEIALNFYPERADFTTDFSTGAELAAHLLTSTPVLARRELSNIFSQQRPQDKEWFRQVPKFNVDKEQIDQEGKEFLDRANNITYRAIYDKNSGFARAVKEGDDSFAAFGQTVISVEYDIKNNNLLVRNWHLRDVVWTDDMNGKISHIYCKRKFTKTEMMRLFKKCAPNLASKTEDKGEKCNVLHVILPTEDYESENGKKYMTKYVSLYIDTDNQFLLSETPSRTRKYLIPRWVTVSGSQYAYSPATVVSISDARMLQDMYETMLDAGEMALNPPLIGVQDAIKSELEFFPGGFTAVDAAYDERLGEVLRPLIKDGGAGIPYGAELMRNVEERIAKAFYLDKVSLPQLNGDMTAFETSQRVSEYVRAAAPLFQPYEMEYNGELMEMIFETLMNVGAYGPLSEIPDSIKGIETAFVFESSMQGAREQQKSQKFLETKAIITEGAQFDPTVASMFKVKEAVRDAVEGIGTPAKWIASREEMAYAEEEAAGKQEQAQMLAALQQGGMAAEQIGKGAQAMQDSGML